MSRHGLVPASVITVKDHARNGRQHACGFNGVQSERPASVMSDPFDAQDAIGNVPFAAADTIVLPTL